MNIVSIVSYPFLPARSGGQKGIALFYKYFSRYHSVTIVSTKKNEPAFATGYEVQNVLSDSRLRYINPFIFFRIRKLLRKKNATHFILEHPYYGWLGIMIKKFCGVRLVVHSHNIESKRWRGLGKWWWRILWYYEKMVHRQADYNYFIQDEDRSYAVKEFRLEEKKCITVSFGTEIPAPPPLEDRITARRILGEQLQIPETTPLLLFNGAFKYAPNLEALEDILNNVNPLLQKKGLNYQLLIVGLDIPESIRVSSYPSIRILGFVENLELYLTGCQVFLNPVVSGGGIKTKLVESLAYDLNAASSENGAVGIDPDLCNHKLIVCPNQNWNLFADAIVQLIDLKYVMPREFYDHFYWGHITKRAAAFIEVDG
jgi:polysaccharide biosynthesis protein PslH